MRFLNTLTFFTLATGLVFALPARARPRFVGHGLSPARNVAPTFRSAPVCSGALRAPTAARDRRSAVGTPPLQKADLKVSATNATGTGPGIEGSQAKPFTQEQVSKMVQAGLGDDSGSRLIEQRGIDITPSEDFVQTLKAAGASEAFLKALRTAKPPEPASARKPINQVQVFALLAGQVPSHRVTILVQERGIDFEPTDDYLQEVRLAGGEDELVSALKSAKVTKPATVDPASQARKWFEAHQAKPQ